MTTREDQSAWLQGILSVSVLEQQYTTLTITNTRTGLIPPPTSTLSSYSILLLFELKLLFDSTVNQLRVSCLFDCAAFPG